MQTSVVLGMAWLSMLSCSQAQVRVDLHDPAAGSAGYTVLEVLARSTDLNSTNWTAVQAGVLAPDGIAQYILPLPSSQDAPFRAFRARAHLERPQVVDDGERFCLTLVHDTPQHVVLMELQAFTLWGPFRTFAYALISRVQRAWVLGKS